MQNTLSLVKDVRGCMTRFDPLTPEIVSDQTEDGLTYDELKEVLEACGLDIEKVVFDGSRAFQNAFYADFEQGIMLDTVPEERPEGCNPHHGSAVSFRELRTIPQES